MALTTFTERRRLELLDRAALETYQLARLNKMLDAILPTNRFYAEKLADVVRPVRSLEQLRQWPFTFKEGLVAASHANDHAGNLTWPLDRYVRFHQTSGTRGRPMVVLDTAEDWQWFLEGWHYVLDAAEIGPADHVLMAFSFGPFIGFWAAYDAMAQRGCLVVPCGGLSTLARLELLKTSHATVICSTPSYAMHMADVAAEHQINLHALGVRRIVVAGEPGGSVPAVRSRLEQAWNARVADHAGGTEVGPWGYGGLTGGGLCVNEAEFIAEFISVETGQPAADGELSEIVLTNLGRYGNPVIRYRTGDLVRPLRNHAEKNRFVRLDGGLLGRSDDMMIIRGVNIFPSGVEQILRSFPEIVEYRLIARRVRSMDELTIEIEDRLEQPLRVSEEVQLRLGLRVEVRCVPLGSLPRFEGKGKRFIDERN